MSASYSAHEIEREKGRRRNGRDSERGSLKVINTSERRRENDKETRTRDRKETKTTATTIFAYRLL